MNRLVLFAAILFCGCYSFRSQVAGDIRTLAIPTFGNESAEFGLSETVTDELIRGFQRDGTLRVVSEGQADAVLVGTLVDVRDEPYTARSGQEITVDEYRFSMMCRIELVIRSTGETKWTQNFQAWSIYPYGGDLSNRETAVTESTTKLVEDLLNKIVGSW
ncbi:MAG: hypothetical protein IPK53_16945 [bacterium]|nr:hypothetical protein [bacterium]MBK8130509.1 hypothetical protein [bacterium]